MRKGGHPGARQTVSLTHTHTQAGTDTDTHTHTHIKPPTSDIGNDRTLTNTPIKRTVKRNCDSGTGERFSVFVRNDTFAQDWFYCDLPACLKNFFFERKYEIRH